MLKLYHRDLCLGEITPLSPDGPWMTGEIHRSVAASDYRDFFQYMTDETPGLGDPPFPEDLLSAENWYVLDESGQRRGIEVPAVHGDNMIMWRWR